MKGISHWHLPQKGSVLWIAALILPPITAAYLMQLAYGVAPWQLSPFAALGNGVCLGALYFLLCSLTGRWVISCLLLHFTAGLWGAINYFVVLYRGTPVLPWDLTSLKTAAAVSGTYSFIPTVPMILSVLLLVALGVFLLLRVGTGRVSPLRRIVCLIACLVCTIPVLNPSLLSLFGIQTDVWDQAKGYRTNGALGSFLSNTAFLKVEKPEGLTTQHLSQLLPQAEAAAPETPQHTGVRPNIVAIMNESWADFEEFGNLTLNKPVANNIPNLDNAVWGHAYASVFGAGTSASEFEFLTGNTMAFLPSGSIPYQQYIQEPSPSLPWLLRQAGYNTMAFHPGAHTSWQRDRAYPLLGFQTFFSKDEMDVPQEMVHGYVSDRADFDQIIWSFEHKQPDQPLFLFNVTIQNHGSYTDESYQAHVQLTDCPGKYPMAEQYLSLAQETDQAFLKLVEYFSQQEEPTLIVMFGDHQPSVEQEFLDLAYGVAQNEMTMEQYMNKYRVPYVIWANYPLDPAVKPADTSLNFLSQYLLEYAGLEGDRYFQFLDHLHDTIPVVTFAGYQDKIGNAYSHLERTNFTPLLQDYQCVQYERLFGLEEKSPSKK